MREGTIKCVAGCLLPLRRTPTLAGVFRHTAVLRHSYSGTSRCERLSTIFSSSFYYYHCTSYSTVSPGSSSCNQPTLTAVCSPKKGPTQRVVWLRPAIPCATSNSVFSCLYSNLVLSVSETRQFCSLRAAVKNCSATGML